MLKFRIALLDTVFSSTSRGKASGKSPSESGEGGNPSEYELNIDGQTERFLASKQQLTYFLVTAAVVPVGFALKLATDRTEPIGSDLGWGLLAAGVGCGIAAAGFSLLSVHFEHRSHRLHIEVRRNLETFEGLPLEKQKMWDRINAWARFFLNAAFASLLAEMPLLAIFLAIFVIE